MNRAASGLVLLACVAAMSQAAWAATVEEFDLDRLVSSSDEIVIGRVVASETRWQGRLIVTVSTVEVEESLKGTQQRELEIVQLGGTAIHPDTGLAVTMTASSQVALGPGEEVLLFVSVAADGRRQLVAAHQGKFVIRPDAATGERQLPIAPKRLRVLRDDATQTVRSEPMTLDEMRRLVGARLQRGRP